MALWELGCHNPDERLPVALLLRYGAAGSRIEFIPDSKASIPSLKLDHEYKREVGFDVQKLPVGMHLRRYLARRRGELFPAKKAISAGWLHVQVPELRACRHLSAA
jgi:hypothetical protein